MPTFVPTPARRGIATALLLATLSAGSAWASDYVLGPMDQLAIDQPRIVFGLSDETDPLNPVLVGPNLFNVALLDTGANGILLGQLSFVSGETFEQAMFNGQPATYDELGVAGTETLDVFVPYGLRLPDPANPSEAILFAEDVIAFGGDDIELGSFAAIVGMPAMDGRVVEMDLRPVADGGLLDPQFIASTFHTQLDQAQFESAASINVNLRMLPPEHTDLNLPEAMRPTFAPLPVIDDIEITHTGGYFSNGQTLDTANTFLMDTGAQTTIISGDMANALGLDLSRFVTDLDEHGVGGDVVDVLEVGGIGGNTFMALVVVDELRLPTASGVDLVFTDVLTGVLDIDGAPFDAVIGMNALMSGYTAEVFGGGGGGSLTDGTSKLDFELLLNAGAFDNVQEVITAGIITVTEQELQDLADLGLITSDFGDLEELYCDLVILEDSIGGGDPTGTFFDKVVFDFTATDGTGIMRLDLTSIQEEGDANLDGFVGVEDMDIILANWGDTVQAGSVLHGDLNGDGLVNEADLNVILANFGNGTPPGGTVPEPASAMLLLGAMAILGRRRRTPLAA